MIPHIPPQRKVKNSSNAAKPFDDLNNYIEGEREQGQGDFFEISNKFNDLNSYVANPFDKETKAEKCIAIKTHGVSSLRCASQEMNATARENKRCKDPAYHFILSWPEFEKPDPESIFDAASHALKMLGLGEHQYILAIHGNTDNMHCHVSVNRVHPTTFKARHIEWAQKTLHMAARQSEIKHGWTHDVGLYVVEVDGDGRKVIVENKDLEEALRRSTPHAHQESGAQAVLPTWHDPDSLDSWLKSHVAKQLKKELPEIKSWQALHGWLTNHDIKLTNTGGGLRLFATSPESGEVLEIAASKGLRLLKRAELEKRWGPFHNVIDTPVITPDLSHLTKKQINQGVEDVLRQGFDGGIPPQHIIRAEHNRQSNAANGGRGLHELPTGGLDGQRPDTGMLLPNTLHGSVDDLKTGEHRDVRRPGAGETSGRSERSLRRDDAKRAERKAERAAARTDLRLRFNKYQQFVRTGEFDNNDRLKAIRAERGLALKQIRDASKIDTQTATRTKSFPQRLEAVAEIEERATRQRLLIEARFTDQMKAVRSTTAPALGWRTWLHEQAGLGDQAALSALRGIVYQAQRDAKSKSRDALDDDEEQLADKAYRDAQHRRIMARLLDDEKKEAAIRSARANAVRPYEADALLARYAGIQWKVTGNGNIEYSDANGDHLYTDRGNRVTFDRRLVTDEEIQLALVHAQTKFGKHITLTGDDLVFTARMARLADDMGLVVLNPEMETTIKEHREKRRLEIVDASRFTPTNPADIVTEIRPAAPAIRVPEIDVTEKAIDAAGGSALSPEPDKDKEPALPIQHKTPNERLRDIVLSIDPRATFIAPDSHSMAKVHVGPVAAQLDGTEARFAQRVGRGVYMIHDFAAPENPNNEVLEITYTRDNTITTTVRKGGRGRA